MQNCRKIICQSLYMYLLVFNLKVQVTREPIVEEALFDVTCGIKLKSEPYLVVIKVNHIGYVGHLSTPDKPMTLQSSKMII